MEKNSELKDFLASRIIATGKEVQGYNHLYYKHTEDLIDGYLDVDFYQKDVFAVLASSNQVFTASYLEAKSVDSFDKNPLAIYYLYIRKWAIEYQNRLYPNIYEEEWLKKLLQKVEPKTEEEQRKYYFWLKHVKKETHIENLFYDIDKQPHGNTLFTTADDLKDIIQEVPFEVLDLFQKQKSKRKYDIVAISNILDWARNDKKKLEIACENLNEFLKPNGTIICSNLVSKTREEEIQEEKIFQKYFQKEKTGKNYLYHKK